MLNIAKEYLLAFFAKLVTSFPLSLLKAFAAANPKQITSDEFSDRFISLCKLISAPTSDELMRDLRSVVCDSKFSDAATHETCIEFWLHVGETFQSFKLVLPYLFAMPNTNAATE